MDDVSRGGSRVISKDEPKRLADGFRSERCANCGEAIGYGYFRAVKVDYAEVPYSATMVPVWWLYHAEPDGSGATPRWCEPKGDHR